MPVDKCHRRLPVLACNIALIPATVTRIMLKKYLQRSKSAPLEVQLRNMSLNWLALLVPHLSRLSSLAVAVHHSSDFVNIARRLGSPIPTLNEFGIVGEGLELEIPSDIRSGHFLYVKKLRLVQVSSLRAPRAFPHVTELVWIAVSYTSGSVSRLLDTMVELPALERVEIEFQGFYQFAELTPGDSVTLPNVQRMSLRRSGGEILGLLEFIELPSLTSLVIGGIQNMQQAFDILPVTSFGKNLPKLAQLPEMEVVTYPQRIHQRIRVAFRSTSQAKLDFYIKPRPSGHEHYRKDWGGLPADSIRRLVVETDIETRDGEDGWVVDLLDDLGSLEHLEFRSRSGRTPQCLRRTIMEGVLSPEIKTLTVYFRSEREARQVHGLKDVVDGLDSGISVTWTKDSAIPDDEQ